MADTSAASAWSREDLAERLVRYRNLVPCTTAFVDTRTPGSDRKENFTIIGPGVSESPDQHVHLDIPHGFNIGGARQPPHCTNSQHSHDTAEVFVVHSGRWAFYLGENADGARVELAPGDTISVPVHVFRGFENIGGDIGFMFAVLGGDDPGRVTWAPYVFEAAKRSGLLLLENGSLVDLARGQTVPEGSTEMAPTTAEQAASFRRLDSEALRRCVVAADEAAAAGNSLLAADGIGETPIIGAARADGMPPGKLDWPHGFQLRKLVLQPGTRTVAHTRPQEEVLLMHRGSLNIAVDDCRFELDPGDVMSIPIGRPRRYGNAAGEPCTIYIVDGGESPQGYRHAQITG